MAEIDRFETQRDVGNAVITELRAAGFDDAVEIRRGSFGIVYRCRQVALDRLVAVKVLTVERDENRDRFLREQRAMGRLTEHPNIVGVLQAGTTESGSDYLVMQYHQRGSLATWIHKNGPLRLEEVLRLGVKMAAVLETVHRLGIVHSDIKPENILFTDFGEPALADFGIARTAGGSQTASGAVSGSSAYSAPEVLSGIPPSSASDVYSLGATLFCALTGHTVFEWCSGENAVEQFFRGTTQFGPDCKKEIPDDICAILETEMSCDPRERSSALEFGKQFQRAQLRHGLKLQRMMLRVESSADMVASETVPETKNDLTCQTDSLGIDGRCLPAELTSFVGRRSQLAEAKNMLSGSRLVTFTGIGGVGKTRLALRVAHKARHDFVDGVWLVDLSDLRDEALLVDVLAAAVGVRNRTARPTFKVLVEFFSKRKILLVLDNCEQIVNAVSSLVGKLIQTCPELKILATSREVLGVGGESVLPVAPLSFPDPTNVPMLGALIQYDAVTLFADRAAAVLPGFALIASNGTVVARICARLDGLPLAIELAAARLRTMSPDQLLQGLDDRYALLTRNNRGVPTRQQNLRWCIDWSYDLCTAPEQRLWRGLSVFTGGFARDAIEAVCGSAPELLDLLSALVEKSILIREESSSTARFRMLETVREYGRGKAEEEGDYLQLCRSHRDWFGQLAYTAEAGWISPNQLEWIARLELELTNIRKALDFSLSEEEGRGLRTAASLYPFWLGRGRLKEGRYWIDRALVASPRGSELGRAQALHATCLLAVFQDDLQSAVDRLDELRMISAQIGAPAKALADIAEGYVRLLGGDIAIACSSLERAVETVSSGTDILLKMRSLQALGFAFVLGGNRERALECFGKVLSVSESLGETIYRGYALWAIGLALREVEQEKSVLSLEDGLRSARLADDPFTAAHCLETLAWIAAAKHDERRAAILMSAAGTLSHAFGSSAALFPTLVVHQEECYRNIRRVLTAQDFDAAHRKGAAMSLVSAIEFALDERPATAETASNSDHKFKLTPRECQVASLVAQGLTNREISTKLVISHRTAQGHVEHILTKLAFTSRAQIAAWVVEHRRDT